MGRTYAVVDGYCPLAVYLGRHGFCLELARRPGVQNSASETDLNLERVIPMAQRLSAQGPTAPILARLDSDFDSARILETPGFAGGSLFDQRFLSYIFLRSHNAPPSA